MRLVSKDMGSQIEFEKLINQSNSKLREESMLNKKVESITPHGRLKSPINFTESADKLICRPKDPQKI